MSSDSKEAPPYSNLPRYASPWYNLKGYRGRILKLTDGTTRTEYEHRMVMEAILARKLSSDEIVHHIDGNKSNNHPENLELKNGRSALVSQ